MTGTSKTYHDSLNALKPFLPKGYQGKILETLNGFTIDHIKRAFSGRLRDEEKLTKILKAAQKLAKSSQEEKEKMVQATISILQATTAIIVLFFAHA